MFTQSPTSVGLFLFQGGLTFRMLGYAQYAKLTLVNNPWNKLHLNGRQ